MPIIEIDYETRSKVDIKKCGAGRYANDPSTRILLVCWAVDNGPIMGSYGEGIPDIFRKAVKEGWTFSAFNAIFEQLIWHYRWPELELPEFRCTRALTASHGLPQGLDRACKALHIGSSKDIEGARLINKYSKPNKEGGFNELKGEDKKKFLHYGAKDVLLSRRIRQRLPRLLDEEQRIYNWTVQANLRGINIDTELAEKAEKIASGLLAKGNDELGTLTKGTILAVTQVQRIKNYIKKEYSVETESLDKEAIAELLLRDSLPVAVRKILELRRDLSQTSVKKFSKALHSVCADGRIRDYLIYHGAATGRWNSQIVQFLNLPRYKAPNPELVMRLLMMGDPELFDLCYKSSMQELTGCIRGMVIPDKGKKLAVVDYASIEARMLLWAAGQQDAVDMFRRGIDIYVEMAQQIYSNKALTKEDTAERFLGKTTTLGCFTRETKVLTKRGWVPIIKVKYRDWVWDGGNWVQTKGVIWQGKKQTIHYQGIGVTPDHLCLHQNKWVSILQVVQESISYQRSMVDSVNLPSRNMNWDLGVVLKVYTLVALAHLKRLIWFTLLTCLERSQQDVITVQRKLRGDGLNITGGTLTSSPKTDTEQGFLIGLARYFNVAIINPIKCMITTVVEGCLYGPLGKKTDGNSCATLSPCLGGTNLSFRLIELIRIKGMLLETLDSLRCYKMQIISALCEFFKKEYTISNEKTDVYDLLCCGPRSRFTILTNIGPLVVHNCGYQMGHIKFQATCDGYGIDLGDKTEYVEREDKEGNLVRTYYSPLARRAVETYRSRFPMVPKFWYGMQEAAKLCVKTGKPYKFGMFTFHIEREYLYMTLPSGRRLAYHRPGCDKDGLFYYTEDSTSFNYVKKRTYGGKLVENAIQACARDILAHGILNLEDKGYQVLLTVHDENVVQIDKDNQLEEITNIMCDVPEWAKGCPISAEGFITERYRKG